MKKIDSNEQIVLSSSEWKAIIIFMGLIVLFLYQAPYMAIVPLVMLFYVVGKKLLEKLNVLTYGEVEFYYNEGSARLGSSLNVKIDTKIPYNQERKYKLVLKNIEFRVYRRSDDHKWKKRSILVKTDKEVVAENSNGFSTIKTTIAIPKDGKITEYIGEQYSSSTYDNTSYYWELEVNAKVGKIINFKRIFNIDVVDKTGMVDRGRRIKSISKTK